MLAAGARWMGAVFIQPSPRWKKPQKRQTLRLARLNYASHKVRLGDKQSWLIRAPATALQASSLDLRDCPPRLCILSSGCLSFPSFHPTSSSPLPPILALPCSSAHPPSPDTPRRTLPTSLLYTAPKTGQELCLKLPPGASRPLP